MYLICYLIIMIKDLFKAIFTLLILDSIYLTTMTSHYKTLISNIQNTNLRLKIIPTICVYLLIIGGWFYFIYKSKNKVTKNQSILNSFIFGIVMYGVYEFTNYAIFEKWTLKTVLIDTLWGGILFSIPTLIVL